MFPSIMECLVVFMLTLATALQTQLSCPEECTCAQGILYCEGRFMESIPSIPSYITKVSMINIMFSHRSLQRSNFTSMNQVTDLTLKSCGLEVIEYNTFVEMANLKNLDLSQNSIRYLPQESFKGLRLTSLYLNNNPDIQFSSNAFHGMTTKSLDLGSNAIGEITSAMLTPLHQTLRKLYLSDNRISRLDSDFRKLFVELETLRIQNNPFACDCQSEWLKRFYDDHQNILEDDDQGEIICGSPSQVAGLAFQRLSTADFSCDKPSLSTSVSISERRAFLSCTSRGSPPPAVFWYRPNGIISEAPPLTGRAINNNDIEINMDQPNSLGRYTCIASNEGGNITLSVNLEWPIDAMETGGTPCYQVTEGSRRREVELRSGKQIEYSSEDESRVFFTKYFSLIDLITAIFGTFLSTLIVTIIILHFCVYRISSTSIPYDAPAESEGYNTGSSDKNTNFSTPVHSTLPCEPLPFYHELTDEHHYMSTSVDERQQFLYNNPGGSTIVLPSCPPSSQFS